MTYILLIIIVLSITQKMLKACFCSLVFEMLHSLLPNFLVKYIISLHACEVYDFSDMQPTCFLELQNIHLHTFFLLCLFLLLAIIVAVSM